MQKSKEKEQKQQHINETENILLKGGTTTGARNYDQKSSGSLTEVLQGIYYVLVDSWHATYPLGSYRYSSDGASTEGTGISYTKLFISVLLKPPMFATQYSIIIYIAPHSMQ
ncbi:hypothetical protein TNCV_5047091 [Trichonephila clavipes]|nr:hypothetical protein TNCV_5047091 [Trichonephila clavipes]